MADEDSTRFSVWSGAGLCIANTIGAGVLLSTGFMAQSMGPGAILIAWVIGGAVAMLGARAYGVVASGLARSGGEYRYLSSLMHPFLGHVAGWGSLVLGFSAPVAVDALAIGAFARTLWPSVDPTIVAVLTVILATLVFSTARGWSKRTQSALVVMKLALVLGLLFAGIVFGRTEWPDWTPPNAAPGVPLVAIAANQFWIAFAFSGWNAAIYAAAEFEVPERDVPRAMLLGLLVVSAIYLGLNWVFVANLLPAEASQVFTYEQTRMTLAHVLAVRLFGEPASRLVSIAAIIVFASAIAAMTVTGPRVYAEMAKDGFLPARLAVTREHTPVASTVLQGSVALFFVLTSTVLEIVSSSGAFLMVFAALTALTTWRLPDSERRGRFAGLLYAFAIASFLILGLSFESKALWGTVALIIVAAAIGHRVARRSRDDR
ncbi:MAG: amino acid permease [Deltaproteobacteria bacterium]|nr:amino acid permease [Deltaproteobacteria bacterium]